MINQSRAAEQATSLTTKRKKISYAKWGYIFILPFVVIYSIFSLYPLLQTFVYSFFEDFNSGLRHIGPNFVGFANYAAVLGHDNFGKYFLNTLILWILCFTPQVIVSLLLAVWFTDRRLKLRGTGFFKTVMYMPNLIMAAAFGYMFQTLLAPSGPIVNLLMDMGILQKEYDFASHVWDTRIIIAFMNFLMWFGNTTLLLMSGVMGIDEDVFEAATVDGAGAFRTFFDITMPLLRPIFVYVFITSLIGGIQLFDVAQMFTKNSGGPDMTSKTLMMFLNDIFKTSQNYGKAGAISTIIFIMTAFLSVIVYFISYRDEIPSFNKKKKNKKIKKEEVKVEPLQMVKEVGTNEEK